VPTLLVINPNSNPTVTAGIDAAVSGLRSAFAADIGVVGLDGTPYGIETQRDVDAVATPVAEHVAAHAEAYDGFVIACFSDPGLHAAREATDRPVLGIAQSGLLTALSLGESIGVISIGSGSLARHWRTYRSMGIAARVAADLPLGATVAELADTTQLGDRMLSTGRRLVEDHGAAVLVLGCAGMAHYRAGLERSLGVTVVDPTQAACAQALGAAALTYRTR
jgi:allantoin racemase